MKNSKGITLISLVVTIIILIILASVATYSGIDVINSSKLTAFTTELKIMQTQVNGIYQKYRGNETIEVNGNTYYGEVDSKGDTTKQSILKIGTELTDEDKTLFLTLSKDSKSGITASQGEGYRRWDKQLIKDLGIEGVEQEVFVNVEKRSIVSCKGLKYEEKMYYTLKQLPDSLYNVEYENSNIGRPTFTITKIKQENEKWKINISNIVYENGYIDKWEVKYKITGKENWNTTKDLSFVVNAPGRYSIKLANGDVESDTQIISIGSWYDNTAKVNVPNLNEDMIPVYWDNANQEKEIVPTSAEEEWNNWYNYVAGDNTNDTKTSKWANAKTIDGNYWVWIPRYEYKILSGEGSSTAGKIEVKFIPKNQTTADVGYKIHPAFINGSNNNFKNGEWDSELSGIWVAKYESAKNDATASSEGSGTRIKIAPGVQSWRNITIGDSYTKSYHYDRAKESHLMKNSEWGAIAYLTQSQYGRNGHEIDINNSSTFITGNGGGSTNASSVSGIANAYHTETGMKASTTGNIYGIYDISGGARERTAAYITNGNDSISSYGSSFAYITKDEKGYETRSTKYATGYPFNSTSDSETNNYVAYKNASYGYGDAILETSTSGSGTTSWFGNSSAFPFSPGPFFLRGGNYDHKALAGTFCFTWTNGAASRDYSFRPVLVGV